jgi:hypothetical protein
VTTRNGFNLAQKPIEDVAPMGEHIEDEPAATRFAIIPARPLRRVGRAVEHPPAEVEPDRQNAPEEISIVKLAQFRKPGQKQFVLHDTVFHTGALGATREIQSILEGFGDRLFEIDVLPRCERRIRAHAPTAGGVCVEIDRNTGVGQTGVAIGAPFEIAVRRRQNCELCRVATQQYRLGHEAIAISEHQAAFVADSHQRAQMLGGTEASRGAVDYDADVARGHAGRSLKTQKLLQHILATTRRCRGSPTSAAARNMNSASPVPRGRFTDTKLAADTTYTDLINC